MARSNPPPARTAGSGWIYGCAVWFIAAAPVIFGVLLGYFIGVLLRAPLGGVSIAAVGAAFGLVVGVISYRYGRRVLREADLYYAEQSRRQSPGGSRPGSRGEGRLD